MDLRMNRDKCEVIPAAGAAASFNAHQLFPGCAVCSDQGFKLLGASICNDAFCKDHTTRRVDKLEALLDKLGELDDVQTALLLLRHCASFSKLAYSTRVVPPSLHTEALGLMDDRIRECLNSIARFNLDDTSWSQAQLPVQKGGLGLRSAERHASAAYIGSRVQCESLCASLDPGFSMGGTRDGPLEAAGVALRAELPDSDPASDFRLTQKQLSGLLDDAHYKALRNNPSSTVAFKAHLELVSQPGAGSWLHALPCQAVKTNIPPSLMAVALQRRLRCQLVQDPFFCPFCSEVAGVFADHCLVCPCNGDRTKRHNVLRNEAFFTLGGAGFQPELEKPGLLPPRLANEGPPEHERAVGNGQRRPADVFVPRWRHGMPAALDFAVTSGLRASVLEGSSSDGSSAATAYETHKRSHLNTESLCSQEGFSFVPLVAEAHGGSWGTEARRAFSNIACHAAAAVNGDSSVLADQLAQRLSCLLQKENARAVLRRLPGWIAPSSAASCDAAVVLAS